LSLFTGDISILGPVPVRMARLAGNLCDHSGIYRSSHVVIKPIICITFKYIRFHIATRRFYPFFIQERPIFGDGVVCAAGAVFRDTLQVQTSILLWYITTIALKLHTCKRNTNTHYTYWVYIPGTYRVWLHLAQSSGSSNIASSNNLVQPRTCRHQSLKKSI